MAVAKPLQLPKRALAIAAYPFAVIAVSGIVIHNFGISAGEFDATPGLTHLEAAGRLRSLAAWLALTAVIILCIRYASRTLHLFDRESRRYLLLAYLAFAVIGIVAVSLGFAGEANRAVADAFIRTALAPQAPHVEGGGALDAIRLDVTLFQLFQGLNSAQRYLLALVTPALVLGAISCLAMPLRPTRTDCRRQADRLNTYLYLSAATLVIGLIFLAAMLRWPAYGLNEVQAKAYGAHVDAYVLYWGITYSILIASYYVPVAVRLAGIGGAAAPPDPKETGEGEEGATTQLIAQAKALAALFAPAIAGLLGGILKL